MQGVVDGVVSNILFAVLLPLLIFIFWHFNKKSTYRIKVPEKNLEGDFDITEIKGLSTAKAYLYKSEKGKDVSYRFTYLGFRRGSRYFLYWYGNRGNGFSIIQPSSKGNFEFEGRNLFFEKIKETEKIEMTTQDFFLYKI